ncbi:hypothetical protein TEA_022220 [Camellia sinensis var. sinensis]|uniref:GDSL esterase/lipase n=1 Tax=Camellia sinensis var. sinensis TaxID=542762 RepID=A0A4S4DST8_CAMSN|nr:hypothetical protein TEA_022220 [Camellia sinensis var. sinensis]
MAPTIFFIHLTIQIYILTSTKPCNGSTLVTKFSTLLIFGDSTVDTGNNNYIKSQMKSNHRPYSQVAMGQFSNGKLVPDFVASMLGIKDIVPPSPQTQLMPLVYQEAKSRVAEQDNPARRGKPTKSVRNCFRQGAIFRAAAAAISMSVEQSLNTRRTNKLLNEAQATMEVGKILGLDFEGKEKEVIGKLTELEQKDLERVEGEGVVL